MSTHRRDPAGRPLHRERPDSALRAIKLNQDAYAALVALCEKRGTGLQAELSSLVLRAAATVLGDRPFGGVWVV